ncbi:MAG: acyl-CoA thioesterase [Deltaproteobacteria bacterium]|nr:acyl-CoA thioesterase [Deltaproteobacteria bacterium]
MTSTNGYGPDNFSILNYRVIYGDTDKMGVVYYANYLRWFEAARSAYLRRRGLPYSDLENTEKVQLPVTEANLRYHRSAMYEQLVDIKVWVTDITSIQVKFQIEVSFEGDLLVRGYTHHAAINMATGRPTRVPENLVNALNRSEQITGNPFF